MNGRITKDGKLEIERTPGKYKAQHCPHCSEIFSRWMCGDHCPLFGNPQINNKEHRADTIDICENRTLYFDNFFDERLV